MYFYLMTKNPSSSSHPRRNDEEWMELQIRLSCSEALISEFIIVTCVLSRKSIYTKWWANCHSPTYFVWFILAEQQYLKLITSCRLIFDVCFMYQCVYTNSWGYLPRSLRDLSRSFYVKLFATTNCFCGSLVSLVCCKWLFHWTTLTTPANKKHAECLSTQKISDFKILQSPSTRFVKIEAPRITLPYVLRLCGKDMVPVAPEVLMKITNLLLLITPQTIVRCFRLFLLGLSISNFNSELLAHCDDDSGTLFSSSVAPSPQHGVNINGVEEQGEIEETNKDDEDEEDLGVEEEIVSLCCLTESSKSQTCF